MPHMLLIIEPVGQREERGPQGGLQGGLQGGQTAHQQMLDFTDELRQAGVLMTSSALPRRRLRHRGSARNRALHHLSPLVLSRVLSLPAHIAVEFAAARSSCD